MTSSIDQNLIASIAQEAKQWRHYLHQHPELSFEEYQTTDYIQKKLKAWGYQIDRSLYSTGLIAVFGEATGKTLAIRAEIDALPIRETTDLSYASKVKQCMHACGHDGHTAILLGAAKCIAHYMDLSGQVILIFQPGEEGSGDDRDLKNPSGAQRLINGGLFSKYQMDEIYTLHNVPSLPKNLISVKKGALLASKTVFNMTFVGKAGHSAYPDKSINAMFPAAQTIWDLENFASEKKPEDLVLTVNRLNAGSGYHVIPGKASLGGLVRIFDNNSITKILQKLHQIGQKNADDYQCDLEMENYNRIPAVINSPDLVEKVWNVVSKFLTKNKIRKNDIKVPTSDDFGCYLPHVLGCYISLGTGTDQHYHTSNFDFNDEVIETGIRLWVGLVNQVLG